MQKNVLSEGTVYEKASGRMRLKYARDRSRDALISYGFQGPTFWIHFLGLLMVFSRSFTEVCAVVLCTAPAQLQTTLSDERPHFKSVKRMTTNGLAKRKNPCPITKR